MNGRQLRPGAVVFAVLDNRWLARLGAVQAILWIVSILAGAGFVVWGIVRRLSPASIVLIILGVLLLMIGVVNALMAFRHRPSDRGGAEQVPIARTRPPAVPSESTSHETERRELLRIAGLLWDELEANRYRLTEARDSKVGWTRPLSTGTYYNWRHSLLTADETDVNNALVGFYQWAYRANRQMASRQANEENSIGGMLHGKGLELDDDDEAEIDEALDRTRNAQEHLQTRRARLTSPTEAGRPSGWRSRSPKSAANADSFSVAALHRWAG